MAKPKHSLVIEVFDNPISPSLNVHCDDPAQYYGEIKNIEGVENVFDHDQYLMVYINIRYDAYEIAEEIRQLIKPTVPESFQDQDWSFNSKDQQ